MIIFLRCLDLSLLADAGCIPAKIMSWMRVPNLVLPPNLWCWSLESPTISNLYLPHSNWFHFFFSQTVNWKSSAITPSVERFLVRHHFGETVAKGPDVSPLRRYRLGAHDGRERLVGDAVAEYSGKLRTAINPKNLKGYPQFSSIFNIRTLPPMPFGHTESYLDSYWSNFN